MPPVLCSSKVRTVEDDRRLVVNAAKDGIDIHGLGLIRFFHGYYDGYCYLPLYVFWAATSLPPSSGAPT